MSDWTDAWNRAAALALTTWPRQPRLLACPHQARRLEQCLAELVEREALPLLGYVILPDAFHLVGARDGRTRWPHALGRVKQMYSRRARGAGPAWRDSVRVRPLGADEIPRILDALHDLPVRAGACGRPEEWPWSSARQASRTGVCRSVTRR